MVPQEIQLTSNCLHLTNSSRCRRCQGCTSGVRGTRGGSAVKHLPTA